MTTNPLLNNKLQALEEYEQVLHAELWRQKEAGESPDWGTVWAIIGVLRNQCELIREPGWN